MHSLELFVLVNHPKTFMLLCFMAAEIVCRIFYGVSVLITKLWREYPHDEEKSEKSEKCLREIKSVS